MPKPNDPFPWVTCPQETHLADKTDAEGVPSHAGASNVPEMKMGAKMAPPSHILLGNGAATGGANSKNMLAGTAAVAAECDKAVAAAADIGKIAEAATATDSFAGNRNRGAVEGWADTRSWSCYGKY